MPIKSARLIRGGFGMSVNGYLTWLSASIFYIVKARPLGRTPLLGGVNRDVQMMIGFQMQRRIRKNTPKVLLECHQAQINKCMNCRDICPSVR